MLVVHGWKIFIQEKNVTVEFDPIQEVRMKGIKTLGGKEEEMDPNSPTSGQTTQRHILGFASQTCPTTSPSMGQTVRLPMAACYRLYTGPLKI